MSTDGADADRLEIRLEFLEAAPVEIDAGADLNIAVKVTAPPELSLGNVPFLIAAAGEVRLTGELPDFIADQGSLVRVALVAPEEIGGFAWRFVIPEHHSAGKIFREASLPFSFRTRPHVTSLAVWDCPSPVVIGENFRLKVGAQCSAACISLRSKQIEIRDGTDAVVAIAPLSSTPWPDTNALYWAEVDVAAPVTAGLHAWTAKFSPGQLRLAHGEATFAFSLLADRPPEHTVAVKVVAAQSDAPLADAQVRLGAYRAATDENGLARLAVPDGEHELFVWKAGYEAPPRTVEVKSDARVRVEAVALPTVNPDSYWQG